MTMRDDAADLSLPWRQHPRAMCRLYTVALTRVFRPLPDNNNVRKYMATGLFTVWAAITLGIAYGSANLGPIQYGAMTAVVYTILGVQWGFEITAIGPIEISTTGDETDQD